ncbi:hypothetical protein ABKN59_002789 [Abortiporus biennis]
MSPCTLFRLPQRTRETRFKIKIQDSRYNRTSAAPLLTHTPALSFKDSAKRLEQGLQMVSYNGDRNERLNEGTHRPIVVIYNDQATFYRSKLNLAGAVAFRTLPWCYTLSDIQHDGTTRYCHISIHPPERDLPKTSFVMSPAVNDLSSLETLLPSGEGMRWETAASRGNRRSPGIMNELRVTVILFLYKLFHGLDWFKWMNAVVSKKRVKLMVWMLTLVYYALRGYSLYSRTKTRGTFSPVELRT